MALLGQGMMRPPAAAPEPAPAPEPAKDDVEPKKKKQKRKSVREVKMETHNYAVAVDRWVSSLAPDISPPAEVAHALKQLMKTPPPPKGGGFGGTPVLYKLFGEPKEGQEITVREMFFKTSKGIIEMNAFIKKWAEKGIIVDYIYNEAKPFDSVYKIRVLPPELKS
jgi:hypothetical protein